MDFRHLIGKSFFSSYGWVPGEDPSTPPYEIKRPLLILDIMITVEMTYERIHVTFLDYNAKVGKFTDGAHAFLTRHDFF